jgi:outer membrane protein OmpA-like peptidoglycan-associated protein
VSDERFLSAYGVSEREALEHYTNRIAVKRNRRRIASQEKMYRKYVKAPIVTEGVRLDTVIRTLDGDFVYEYVQTVATRPKLRKVDIVLSGSIYEEDRPVYVMPRSEPLSFYISSVSSFADATERYLTRVVSRRAEANASYRIEFAKGKSDIDPSLADNLSQIGFVKDNLAALLANETFDLDSIVVVANASPEGSWGHNGSLSRRRGEAVSRYFSAFMRERRREATLEGGFAVDESGEVSKGNQIPEIRFITRSVPENWSLLDRLVRNDDALTDAQKEHYFSLEGMRDADGREAMMRNRDYYRHLADSLYPKLRIVDFAFHLHRKGMVKDTVHTTELDKEYMRGVQLLRDMDYNEAVKILGPYRDFNAALAYVACDRNASALDILTRLEKTAPVNYLLAIVRARQGDEQAAVEHYLRSCAQDPSFVHRGNLDPEISALIRLYGLNQQTEEP